ncbi:hypothetical protein Tco_0800173, partial [Tanacetum coccineum]
SLKKQKDNPYKTSKTVCIIGILKKIYKKKAQEDEGDMDDGWDIMVEDVERLRKILTPTIHTLPNLKPVVQSYMPLDPVCDEAKVKKEEEHDYNIPLQDGIMQPLTPQTVHITPPYDVCVAPATNNILDKHLNEFLIRPGYVLWKLSRDFTRLLGPPSGLKGLLHTLNTTVIPTKVIRFSLYILLRTFNAYSLSSDFRGYEVGQETLGDVYSQKDKNEAKTDKIEHEIEKSKKSRS